MKSQREKQLESFEAAKTTAIEASQEISQVMAVWATVTGPDHNWHNFEEFPAIKKRIKMAANARIKEITDRDMNGRQIAEALYG